MSGYLARALKKWLSGCSLCVAPRPAPVLVRCGIPGPRGHRPLRIPLVYIHSTGLWPLRFQLCTVSLPYARLTLPYTLPYTVPRYQRNEFSRQS